LTLDDAALEKVEAYPKLQEVKLEDDIENDFVIPRGESEVEPVWYTVNKQPSEHHQIGPSKRTHRESCAHQRGEVSTSLTKNFHAF
jgi:hypothetical protein